MLTHDVLHAVLCLCEEANSPRAVSVAILARYGEMDQLVDLTVDPLRYTSSSLYFRDCLVTDILRKCRGLEIKRDLKAAAVKSFWASELECYRTNERLAPYFFGLSSPESNERVWEVLSLARKYIANILGTCPVLPSGRHGPGATFADRGKYSTVPDKMSSSPTLTCSALGVIPSWSRTAWARAVSEHTGHIEVVRGNRFTTVPKDSAKDRGIAVEPSLNIFYQLGYGGEIRRKLKRVGIDLNHGQDLHRRKAKEASLKGTLATIDLSSASDTVSRSLVELLLPPVWFRSLAALRSSHTRLGDKWVFLEKFSSMGNGYTFELETLIFLALAFAVLALGGHLPKEGDNLCVFGDDIIIPTAGYEDVVACLRFFGFSINKRKSFSVGPFRESCGGDFFDGRPVRAFYLEELPSEPHQWVAFANGLRRVVKDHHLHDGDFDCHLRAWRSVLHCIPRHIRDLRGPENLGDIVVHDHATRWSASSREAGGRRKIIGPYSPGSGDGIRYFRTWSPISTRTVGWQHFRPAVTLASALLNVGDGERGVTPRDSVSGYGVRWVPFS